MRSVFSVRESKTIFRRVHARIYKQVRPSVGLSGGQSQLIGRVGLPLVEVKQMIAEHAHASYT